MTTASDELCVEGNNSNSIEDSKELVIDVQEGSGRDSGLSSTTSPRFLDSTRAKDIVLSSHRELQEAKQKLEELRLLRFEEKSVLKNEINQLHEKVDEEERNSSFLEDRLTALQLQKEKELKRVAALEKEQAIGCQINMMQEQEIVRLEMKLKEFDIEKFSMAKQIDLQRRTIAEKDKQRTKQESEIYALTEKINHLEEIHNIVKLESEQRYDKLRTTDDSLQTLKKELVTSNRELENVKAENSSKHLELQQSKMSIARLEDLLLNEKETVKELKEKMGDLKNRCFKQIDELQEREEILQQDLETASINENKITEKYEAIEHLYHETRRKNDEQHFEIQQYNERIHILEEQLRQLEDQKTEVEFDLNEIQTVLKKHIPSKETSEMLRSISPEELTGYFETTSSKMSSLKYEVSDLSSQIKKEQTMMAEMNSTIAEVKRQLEKTRENLTTTGQMKEVLESQLCRANDTILGQEREITRHKDEINHLRELLGDYENRVHQLESDVEVATKETSANEIIHNEEKRKLKNKFEELENICTDLQSDKRNQEESFNKEKLKLQEKINEAYKNKQELKSEMQSLIDDNKNLAQRLIHLESYSDKLGVMLESHQNENDKIKEKLHKETKTKRALSEEKNAEINELNEKVGEMNRSLNEKNDKNDKLGNKIRIAKEDQKGLEKKMKELDRNNEQLEKKLFTLSEAQKASENTIASKNNDINTLHRRFKEQSKHVEDLLNKINVIENDKQALLDRLAQYEKRMNLKENLISELSKKTCEATDAQNELKSSIQKSELERRQQEVHSKNLKQENRVLEKSMRDVTDEKLYLKEQITDLRRLLAKTEDEKEQCINDLTLLQEELSSQKLNRRLEAELDNKQQKRAVDELKQQMSALSDELDNEKRRRQRLETMYNKRDDQVSQLRSTFDKSLNTINNDTKNIKSILGKSLQKIDRQMLNNDGLVTDSDVTTENESELNHHSQIYSRQQQKYSPQSKKYLNLSNSRTKSLDTTVDVLKQEKFRGQSSRSTPLQSYPTTARSPLATSSVLLPSKKPNSVDLETTRESKRRNNKRLTR